MEVTRTGNNFVKVTGDADIRSFNISKMKEVNSNDDSIPVSKGQLEESVKVMNDIFNALNTHLKFSYHEGTGQYYVSLVNENTNEVVREIPPKKFLDMVAYMEKQMKGIFVDQFK